MRRINAQQVYEKLINEDHILTKRGQIRFNLDDVDIIVKQKDVVGNIMQEWLQGWFDKNGIEYSLNPNTQMPPDFYLNPDNRTTDLLEVKAFNYKASPAFDLAAFTMYEREIRDHPYMLDVSYLIFGYEMSDEGVVTIRRVWLQKIWEIIRPMRTNGGIVWPISLQIKQNVVQKIRPCKWYSRRRTTGFRIFNSKEDFVSAIEETVHQDNDTRAESPAWLQTFCRNYREHYGVSIEIPRWHEIKDQYVL